MTLQLADKNLELPLGLLEHVIVKSCGIEYEHTFAVVDFGQDPSYEVILGRPFMRQLMVIQDWGYNYLYLRHDDVITRVNLQDHSYRDVTKSPIEEFESGSSYLNPSKETDLTSEIGAWICQVHSQNLLDEEKILTDKAVVDEAYIPQPFPEDEIDPHLWIQVLATIDTSALEPGIQFCDEQGYDVIPIRMVTPIYLEEQGDDIQAEFLLRIQQEVSICDQASTRNENGDSKDHSTTMLPKAKSPPRFPPNKQILPLTTTDLIRSQVMYDQERNAEIEQAKNANCDIALAVKTTTTSNVNSSVSPNKEALKLTIISIEKDAQSCVTVKTGTEPVVTQKRAHITQPHDAANVNMHVKTPIPPTRIAINIQSKNGPQIQSIALLDRCVQYKLDFPSNLESTW